MSTKSVNLYDNLYADFASDAEPGAAGNLRRAGPEQLADVAKWLGFADQLGIANGSDVLEVGGGSAAPLCTWRA